MRSRSLLVRGSFIAALVSSSALLSGCVTSVPVEEYNLARAAHDAAKDADCVRYAPSLWFNAEQAYRDGQKAYHDRRYKEAKESFDLARQYAEQAENTARLARRESGDVAP